MCIRDRTYSGYEAQGHDAKQSALRMQGCIKIREGSRPRHKCETCVHGDWAEAKVMVEGMLAEPWHLIGYQENRLREFLELLQVEGDALPRQ